MITQGLNIALMYGFVFFFEIDKLIIPSKRFYKFAYEKIATKNIKKGTVLILVRVSKVIS